MAITRRAEPAIRFLIAWAVGWWLVVEAVPTKLPNYLLPAYPALAILAALWLLAPKTAEPAWLPRPPPPKKAGEGRRGGARGRAQAEKGLAPLAGVAGRAAVPVRLGGAGGGAGGNAAPIWRRRRCALFWHCIADRGLSGDGGAGRAGGADHVPVRQAAGGADSRAAGGGGSS